MSVSIIIKGGPGSGHHGHQGRPGKRGGSLPGGGGSNKVVVYHGTRTEFINDIKNNGLQVRKGADDREGVFFATDKNEALYYLNISSGWAGEVALVEFEVDMDKAIYDEFDAGFLGARNSYYIPEAIPSDAISKIEFYTTSSNPREGAFHVPQTVQTTLSGKSIYNFRLEYVEELKERLRKAYMVFLIANPNISKQIRIKGGPGSGHHGHQGRPGKRGGSLPGGDGGGSIVTSIHDKLVALAGTNERRKFLAEEATTALRELEDKQLLEDATEIRVVGSYAGDKIEPGDVDILVFIPDEAKRKAFADAYMQTNQYAKEVKMGKSSTVQIMNAEPGSVWSDWLINNTRERYGVDPLTVWSASTISKEATIRIKGGPGSGHHGHQGRLGQRGGSAPGSGGRVWTGEAVPRGDKSKRISKLRTGEIGEQFARQALAEKFGVPFVELNQGINNAPIDIAGDHHAVEVKAGLATNGKTAQHWRATIGQPGKEEAELIKQMTSAEKRAHNVAKEQAILARKNAMLSQMSEDAGVTIKPATVGVILSEDGSRGDVYFVPGFHLRLTWQEYATEDYYLGTYDMTTVQKGGPGSGHHGHAGRPGKQGGSLPGGGTTTYADVKLTQDEYAAIRGYTGYDSETINRQLGSGVLSTAKPLGLPSIAEKVHNIDNAIAKMPPVREDKKLYSLFDASSLIREDDLQVGKLIHRKGYTSTTDFEGGVRTPGNNPTNSAVLVLNVPKGTTNVAPISALSQHPGESEWLVGRGLKYKITNIEAPHSSNYTNFIMNRSYVIHADIVGWDVEDVSKEARIRIKGGPGSGHHGHQGRPGQRGGSAPSGIAGSTDISIIVSADKYPPGTKVIDIQERQPNGSPIRGQEVISPDDPRIGDEVYHMTTNMSGVRESGELSARGAGGLGGDAADQIVSMTVDKGIAEQLTSDMRFTVQTARDFYEGEPKPKWNGTEWKVYDRNGNEYDPMPWANKLVSRLHQRSLEEGWSFGGPEGRPDVQMRQYQIGDWMRQYFMQRGFQAKINNPFIFTDAEQLRHLNPNNIGIVSIPRNNLRTGALLVNFDLGKQHLEEIRLYGDVPLSGATISKETNIRIRQV